MRLEVNARGLSSVEIQKAIDDAIDCKNMNVAEAKKKVDRLLMERISIDSMFALSALEAIQQHHPKMLKDKIVNKDAAIDLNDLEVLEAE